MKAHKIIGIYAIKTFISDKVYIGQSVDIFGRYKKHMQELRGNRHKNNHLQSFYNKHGESSLYLDILEECSPSAMDKTEQYYINSFTNVFNICNVVAAYSLRGRKLSNITKQKLREGSKCIEVSILDNQMRVLTAYKSLSLARIDISGIFGIYRKCKSAGCDAYFSKKRNELLSFMGAEQQPTLILYSCGNKVKQSPLLQSEQPQKNIEQPQIEPIYGSLESGYAVKYKYILIDIETRSTKNTFKSIESICLFFSLSKEKVNYYIKNNIIIYNKFVFTKADKLEEIQPQECKDNSGAYALFDICGNFVRLFFSKKQIKKQYGTISCLLNTKKSIAKYGYFTKDIINDSIAARRIQWILQQKKDRINPRISTEQREKMSILKRKSVYCYGDNLILIAIYQSIEEASRSLGIRRQDISKSINGYTGLKMGFIFCDKLLLSDSDIAAKKQQMAYFGK